MCADCLIVTQLDDGNLHRVWVVEVRDGKPYPTFCISQRDILRYVLYLMGLKSSPLEDMERQEAMSD